jgi:hypothetical protein
MSFRCKKTQEFLSYLAARHHKLVTCLPPGKVDFYFYKTIFAFPVKVAKGNDNPPVNEGPPAGSDQPAIRSHRYGMEHEKDQVLL